MGSKRENKTLEESEARYRLLIKHSPDAIFLFNPRTRKIIEVNDQFLNILGYTEEDVARLTLKDILVLEDKTIRLKIQEMLERGQAVFGVRQYKRADGSLREIEVGARLIRSGTRQVVMVNMRDVTERNRVERALKESEDRYRTIFETTACATVIIDEDMTVSLVNSEFERLSGHSKEEIEGRIKWTEFLEPRDMERVARYHTQRRIDPTGAPRNYEFQFVRTSGEQRTIFMTSALIPGTTKNIASLLDITDRVAAENALRESDRRYRTLFEESSHALYTTTPEGRLIDCNQAMLDLFGYTREEMARITMSRLYRNPREDMKLRSDVRKKGVVRDRESRFRRKDGTELSCLHTASLRHSGMDRILGYEGIIQNITERKRAEEALLANKDQLEQMVVERTGELQKANERLTLALTKGKRIEIMMWKGAERYKKLYENSPLGMYRTNPHGRLLMANPALVRMLGYASFLELASTPVEWGDYEPSYLQPEFRKLLAEADRVRNYEAAWKRPDGSTIFVRERARVTRAGDGTILYCEGTVENITERKKAEEKVQAYQEELRSLASELSFAEERERRRIAVILHDDVGQLLAVSKMRLDGLGEVPLAGELKTQIDEVRGLVGLAISHTRSLTFELSPPVLHELGFVSALEWLGEQMEKTHGFRFVFQNDPEPKIIDKEVGIFLFTSVRELLVNVAKHAEARTVWVSLRMKGEEIVVEVRDDGRGFPPAKADVRSRGFGLFSIRERLRHLGGRILIESNAGMGAAVTLSAPAKMTKT
ncbi:MAG TPA: PAS domain S-box protein [Syntrophorhabdaceae bacterium]|jgi:PAS domain S-box-containing protein